MSSWDKKKKPKLQTQWFLNNRDGRAGDDKETKGRKEGGKK